MQVALCLVVDSVQKGVKLSCRQYVQDVKINHKIVLKKKVQLTCRQYAKGVKLSCRQCAKDVTFSCRQRKRKTSSLVMLQTLCHKPPKVRRRQYAKKKFSLFFDYAKYAKHSWTQCAREVLASVNLGFGSTNVPVYDSTLAHFCVACYTILIIQNQLQLK